MKIKKKKIFVGVSGGVDSSVALALLKKQGYDVTGCFMKNWSRNLPGLECNWVGDREDALRVCAKLNVPFRTVDLEKTYYEKVFKNFISEYRAGRTPNPDILCNSEVKFKAFLDWAIKNGADMIATGHYARVKTQSTNMHKTQTKNQKTHPLLVTRYSLHVARDSAKDQSYFLYRLGQKELSKTLFPIGEHTKPEVRTLAKKFGLPTADKPDSQGVCFVGEVSLEQFLRNFIQPKSGKIMRLPAHINLQSEILNLKSDLPGHHPGVHYFTVGQRHGIGIPGGGEALYVAMKDVKKNILYVAAKNHPALQKKEMLLKNMHWVAGTAPKLPLNCEARIRYRQPLQNCRITNFGLRSTAKTPRTVIRDSRFVIRFADPQWAPAPGQSVVFYAGEEMLGGGVLA